MAARTAAKLVSFLLLIYISMPHAVLASVYGSGKYSNCSYGTGCGSTNAGFWYRWGAAVFLLIFLLSLYLLLLIWRRRKKDEEKKKAKKP